MSRSFRGLFEAVYAEWLVCKLVYMGGRRVLLRGRFYRVDEDALCVIVGNGRADTDPPREVKI